MCFISIPCLASGDPLRSHCPAGESAFRYERFYKLKEMVGIRNEETQTGQAGQIRRTELLSLYIYIYKVGFVIKMMMILMWFAAISSSCVWKFETGTDIESHAPPPYSPPSLSPPLPDLERKTEKRGRSGGRNRMSFSLKERGLLNINR